MHLIAVTASVTDFNPSIKFHQKVKAERHNHDSNAVTARGLSHSTEKDIHR